MSPARYIICASAIAVLLAAQPLGAQIQFAEVGQASGIGPYVMSSGMGAGIAAADYDQDGYVDVFVPNAAGIPDQLYHNLGDGTFEEIAGEAGVAALDQSRVALWFDYDGDADLDLVVANDLEGMDTGLRLYRQDTVGQFEEVTVTAGLYAPMPPRAQAQTVPYRGGLGAGDINHDGYLDLLCAQWNGEHQLFLNNTDGTFTDISQDSGINQAFYYGHQPMMYDFDRDGATDIYMAIDFLWNALFINSDDNTFVDVAPACGADNAMNDMGMTLGDYDNDGDLDVYISNITAPGSYNILLRNDSQPPVLAFTEIAEQVGVDQGGWGWGVTFFDADNDGWLDIAATNGWVTPMFEHDPSRLYHNLASTFEDVSDESGFNDTEWGSALIAFDYDRDGDVDLMQSCNAGGPLRLLENRTTHPPTIGHRGPNHWIVVQPRSASPNHFAIGAVVRIQTGNLQQMRLITAGCSYLGQEPAEAVFGLGSAHLVERIIVEWPNGPRTVVHNVPVDQVFQINQPAEPRPANAQYRSPPRHENLK